MKSKPIQSIASKFSNQIEEFHEGNAHEHLDAQYGKTRRLFKGKILAPYNRTYKELAISSSKESDSHTFFCWLLIYSLLRGQEIYETGLQKYFGNVEAAEDEVDTILPLVVESDIEKWRASVRKFSRRLTDKDAETASGILLEMRKEAELGAVKGSESGEDVGK